MERNGDRPRFRKFPISLLLNYDDGVPRSLPAVQQGGLKTTVHRQEQQQEQRLLTSEQPHQSSSQAQDGLRGIQQDSGGGRSHNSHSQSGHTSRSNEEGRASGADAQDGGGSAGGAASSRKRWSPEEDEILREAVATHGPRHWDMIASFLPGRNGQHARLRYNNYVRFNEDEKKRPFREEEDRIILEAGCRGAKWCSAAKQLGRSNNAVKNRFHLLKRKLSKENNAGSGILFISPILEDPVNNADAAAAHQARRSQSGSPSAAGSRERMEALLNAASSNGRMEEEQ
mmetsp:Transcript_11917/g.25925  ORF Transcript_11917/g.25925 Transcript_11917/m.25925 type:complete len:286 (-) Transcript_11917:259-1116(-)